MKVRPAMSMLLLTESLEQEVEIASREELMAYLQRRYEDFGPTAQNVTCEPYGYDHRIGWDTYLICVDGKAALFADGPIPETVPGPVAGIEKDGTSP